MKLNTNGSCPLDVAKAGYSGLLRDNSASWLARFFGVAGQVDILQAELIGMKQGLLLA